MDITMLPPSTILSNHSHHLYHPLPLLPSALPRNTTPFTCSHSGITPYRRHAHVARYYEPLPPSDDSSPLSELPDELVLEIFRCLDWKQLLPLQRTCRRFNNLAKSGSLHHSLILGTIPPSPIPPTLERILPHVRNLHLALSPYPSLSGSSKSILNLLDAILPNQLISLSLPFSAPYLSSSDLGRVIRRLGGRLEKLDLRGSGVSGKEWLEWIGGVGKDGKGLKELDLGFTNITELPHLPDQPMMDFGFGQAIDRPLAPPPAISPFMNLKTLSLASCTSLSASTIYTFLSTLPPRLCTLDLSRLEQTSFEALKNMRVTHFPSAGQEPTALREVKVIGIDHLTRLDIRKLKYHWETQRQACSPGFSKVEEPEYISRVWGEPRTPDLRINFPTPTTPDSLPRLSTSYGSSSGPSSLGSTPSFGRLDMDESPQLLTPENSYTPPPERYTKHPFLTGLHEIKGQGQYVPYSTSTGPISIKHRRSSEEQRHEEFGIKIVHSAILESEDEAGYRQFIGEVAGGTVGLGQGYGHELGMRWLNAA